MASTGKAVEIREAIWILRENPPPYVVQWAQDTLQIQGIVWTLRKDLSIQTVLLIHPGLSYNVAHSVVNAWDVKAKVADNESKRETQDGALQMVPPKQAKATPQTVLWEDTAEWAMMTIAKHKIEDKAGVSTTGCRAGDACSFRNYVREKNDYTRE